MEPVLIAGIGAGGINTLLPLTEYGEAGATGVGEPGAAGVT